MHAAEGILTARGGMTSHAAVVARGWGKPCVCGCAELSVQGEKVAVFESGSSQRVELGAGRVDLAERQHWRGHRRQAGEDFKGLKG